MTGEPLDALTNTLTRCTNQYAKLRWSSHGPENHRLLGWAAWIMTGEVLRQRARVSVGGRILVSIREGAH
jgi:hypothetical protein